MGKKIKRSVVLLLALVLSIMLFPGSASADSEQELFTPRLTAPESGNAYYYSLNYYYNCGYGMPNCVAYVYGRIYEINQSQPLITHGDASQWWAINEAGGFYETGDTPEVGAIVCWTGGRSGGHVAVVEAVDGNMITISESHYGGKFFDTRTIRADGSDYLMSMHFRGYMYASHNVAEAVRIAEEEAEKQALRDGLRRYKTDEPDLVVAGGQSTFEVLSGEAQANGKKVVSERNLLASGMM